MGKRTILYLYTLQLVGSAFHPAVSLSEQLGTVNEYKHHIKRTWHHCKKDTLLEIHYSKTNTNFPDFYVTTIEWIKLNRCTSKQRSFECTGWDVLLYSVTGELIMTIMGNLLSYLLTLSTIHSMKLSIYYIKGNPKGLQNDFELHSEIFYREREIFARLTIT